MNIHKLISAALSVISLTPILQSTADAEKWTSAFDSRKTAQSISLKLNFNPLSLDSIEKISDAAAKFALKSDTTSAEYTQSGNYMSSQTDALGNTVSYSYDESKGILLSSTDAKGNQTSYSYDINDRVTNVAQGGISVNYTYDSNNQLSTVTHNGTSYSLIYDALGRSKQTKIGTRLLVDNMYFAESGLLRKAAYGNGNTREYEYDRQGRVKKMIIDGVDRFSYTYDSQGNLLSYTDLVANEKFTYVYDFLGRPVQVRTSSGFKIKLTYDEFNRASDVEFVNGSESNKTSWVFGNDSIVTGVKYNGVEKISYTYDLLKRQTAKTINTTNPFVTQYQYKNINNYRTSTLIDKISYSDGTALSYTYDANGNILTIADVSGNIVASYTYDNLNQLTGATVGSDVYTYTYDNGGNITAKTKNGVEVAYTYGNTEWKDLLTAYNGISISYDTIGNPLNWINGETFTWSGGRQLTGITKGDNTISYTYNDSGIRTSKTVNGIRTDYYLNGTAIIMQKTGDNVIWYTYDENGNIAGMNYNGSDYWFYRNAQNDVIGIVDSSGAVVAKYTYDDWGKIVAVTDGQGNDLSSDTTHIANINPIRYRGYYYDIETGLYYINSRYYDAEIGRFLNTDSAMGVNADMGTYNLFVYCGNNPVNRYDAAGLFWKELIRGVIHAGNDFAISIGIDTAAIGAFFLDMYKDDDGIYHAEFDCWQQYFGYNDMYDFFFDLGTSCKPQKFPFTYEGVEYIIWMWKGDYINLGAGAEMGIYTGGEPHWRVDKSLAMSMSMEVQYKGETIISHSDYTWWITGFNPNYQNKNRDSLRAYFSLKFNDAGMFLASVKSIIVGGCIVIQKA